MYWFSIRQFIVRDHRYHKRVKCMVSNNVLSYNRLRSVVLNLAFTLKNYCKVHSVKNCGIFLMLYSFSIQQCLAQLSVLEVDICIC